MRARKAFERSLSQVAHDRIVSTSSRLVVQIVDRCEALLLGKSIQCRKWHVEMNRVCGLPNQCSRIFAEIVHVRHSGPDRAIPDRLTVEPVLVINYVLKLHRQQE